MPPKSEQPRTRVYFIRPVGMQGPIKIGCSVSPDGRRDTLATWSPFPLEIVGEIEGGFDLERRFHTLFADQHKGREWFEWSPALEAMITSVAAGNFKPETLPEPGSWRRFPQRKAWSEESKQFASITRRVRATTKKTGRHLPKDVCVYSWRDSPEARAAIEAFLADPVVNGLTFDERFPPAEREAQRLTQVRWYQGQGKPVPDHLLTPITARAA